MNEMVKRVARALYEGHCRRGNISMRDSARRSAAKIEQTWEEAARIAIAAMREPTGAMMQAGAEPAQNSSDPAYWCWRAMIDAALIAPSSPVRPPE